ncbi:MAG: hypothetical protein ACRDRV_06670, partial [Pseudonocardiaceae bacterium]
SFAIPLPARTRDPGSTQPAQPGSAVVAVPPVRAPVPAPLEVPALIKQVPTRLETVVPLSPQPLTALPEVPPLVKATPPLITAVPPALDREGPLTPQSLPALPDLRQSAEESLAELDLLDLP